MEVRNNDILRRYLNLKKAEELYSDSKVKKENVPGYSLLNIAINSTLEQIRKSANIIGADKAQDELEKIEKAVEKTGIRELDDKEQRYILNLLQDLHS
ncbi:MAG: hypothetical protein ACOCP4_05350 [Candidatus Woesearchaeota archaeon]